MRLLRSTCSLAFLGGLAMVTAAHADPVELTLNNSVPAGKKPSLVVVAREDLGTVTLEIERLDDKKHFRAVAGPLTAGGRAELLVGDGKTGHARWKGHLVVKTAGGQIANEVTFETSTGGAQTGSIHVMYDRAHLDLERGRLEIQINRPAQRAALSVVGDDGEEIAHVEKSLSAEKPNTWFGIEWKPSTQPVLRLELRVAADDGEAVVRLVPWSVAIAHEEVIFPSGQAAIPPTEEKKLDASYGKIVEMVEKVRKHEPSLAVRVYVAGYTDTVGGSDENRKLSHARAKSIAAWFRDRGLPMPLFFAGFGEEQPRVKTADNVDEARNRRADYVVGVEEPANSRGRYTVLK